MHDPELQNLLSLARSGDEQAREQLIRTYRSYIVEVAAGYCGRQLEWENDDELSISLLAFSEAIDTYNPSSGKEFRNYARMVIKNRLIDYFRKEARHRHLPLEGPSQDSEEVPQWEAKMAWEQYREDQLAQERAEEMACFEQVLQFFGFSLGELERSCPKHRDTRDTLVRVARFLASREDLATYVNRYKQLPLKELSRATGVSRKVLKHGRQYILAVFLIVSRNDFSHLRSLFSLSLETLPGTGKDVLKQTTGLKGGDPR
jgi:RNA polymerase sigma factor